MAAGQAGQGVRDKEEVAQVGAAPACVGGDVGSRANAVGTHLGRIPQAASLRPRANWNTASD
jgi:hypothetical protein